MVLLIVHGPSTRNFLRFSRYILELSFCVSGSYGTVYKARDRSNPKNIVALKKVRVPLTEDGVPFNTLREIALLKQLDQYEHPNIVR